MKVPKHIVLSATKTTPYPVIFFEGIAIDSSQVEGANEQIFSHVEKSGDIFSEQFEV